MQDRGSIFLEGGGIASPHFCVERVEPPSPPPSPKKRNGTGCKSSKRNKYIYLDQDFQPVENQGGVGI